MNARISSVILVLAVFPGFIGCGKEKTATRVSTKAPVPKAPDAAGPASTDARTGTVLESLSAPPYTYVHVDTGESKIWVAAPALEVKVGDRVALPAQMSPMKNWPSKALDRTFDVVYLAQEVAKVGEGKSASSATKKMPEGHPAIEPGRSAPIDLSGITKAEGGKTVAEIFAGQEALSGKQVVFRGKVVKSNAQIMGKNWLHIRDGTGDEKTNDLTVTTDEALPQLGDIVVVTGQVTLNKDFGAGYKYAVIIEDATFKKE
ncbi:MAG: hypothetical protein O3B01_04470 [Planctomycetota bacterium]|nr:hypothetical protein [Planctomycetota bacterium]MDA1137816.1 hypothetical protein [Planctomycetota bacterium]